MPPKRKAQQKGDNESAASNESESITAERKKQKNGDNVDGETSDFGPVVTKSFSKDNSASNAVPLSPSLTEFFGGSITEHNFLSKVFRKKALYVDCRNENVRQTRVSQLVKEMFHLDPQKILSETSSDNIFVWLRGKTEDSTTGKTRHTPNGLIQSIEVDNVDTAIALHSVGHATYCRAPPTVEQNLVASLLRATGMGCGQYDPTGESMLSLGRGEVETFLSTPGHVTDWHFDFQENFTIQLSGTKKWTLMEGTIVDPLRGCTPHYNSPESVESQMKAAYLYDKKFVFGKPNPPANAKGEEQSIVMKPGDVLYFPAGMWHKVEAIDPGVSINVSLMATNYAHAISQAVYHYLYKDARFRQPIINNSVMSAPNHLQELMQDLPGIIQQLSKPNGEGAHDILPPALQFPPNFTSAEEEDSIVSESEPALSDNEEALGGDDENENGEPANNPNGGVAPNNDQDQQQESDGDSALILETLYPEAFTDYPSDWNFSLEMGTKLELYKNPLSALHKLEEFMSFYDAKKSSNRDSVLKMPGIFVLNVNYGGNEAHESAVRAQFQDNHEGMVERLWELERKCPLEVENVPLDACVVTEDNHYLISFLVFHGYMQVKATGQ